MDRDGKRYKTKSTPQSAWLVSEGYELLSVERIGNRSFFIFRDSPELQEAVTLWKSGEAHGNTRGYYEAYRKVVSLAKKCIEGGA
jgi:hypothetical protein